MVQTARWGRPASSVCEEWCWLAGKFGASAAVGQVLPPKAQMLGRQDWKYVSGGGQVWDQLYGHFIYILYYTQTSPLVDELSQPVHMPRACCTEEL